MQKMHHRIVRFQPKKLQCLWVSNNKCVKCKVSTISGSWASKTPVFKAINVRYTTKTTTTSTLTSLNLAKSGEE